MRSGSRRFPPLPQSAVEPLYNRPCLSVARATTHSNMYRDLRWSTWSTLPRGPFCVRRAPQNNQKKKKKKKTSLSCERIAPQRFLLRPALTLSTTYAPAKTGGTASPLTPLWGDYVGGNTAPSPPNPPLPNGKRGQRWGRRHILGGDGASSSSSSSSSSFSTGGEGAPPP